jgi:hypothetical protein
VPKTEAAAIEVGLSDRHASSRSSTRQGETHALRFRSALKKPKELDHVRSLVTDDVTYVALNCETPDLTSIMPWCGAHEHAAPESIVNTFVEVGRYWEVIAFGPEPCSAPANTRLC